MGDAHPASEATGMALHIWRIRTSSGSTYLVAQTPDGRWFFGGSNVPNAHSQLLPAGFWPIEAPHPWPPVTGASICLLALRALPLEHPQRVPGGGKVTSPVLSVDEVSPS